MSLKRLMNNYMTIQTSEGAAKTIQGAIDRQNSWITLVDFKNVRCNIQEKQRSSIVDVNYGRNDEEHIDIIYHQSSLLNSYEPDQTQLRIITAKDPRMALIFPITEDNNLKIYEFKGHIEQIKHRKRFKFYILRCERNDRQIFA